MQEALIRGKEQANFARNCNEMAASSGQRIAVAARGNIAASQLLGDPPIIIQVQAFDLPALNRLILNEIATIPGVEQVETNVIVDIAKWRPGAAQLNPKSLPRIVAK